MCLCYNFNGQNFWGYLQDPKVDGGRIILKWILSRVATTGICDHHLISMCGDKSTTIW